MVDKNTDAAVDEAVSTFEKLYRPVRGELYPFGDFGAGAMEHAPGSQGEFEELHIEECQKNRRPANEPSNGVAGPVEKYTAEGFSVLRKLELVRMLLLEDGQSVYHLYN